MSLRQLAGGYRPIITGFFHHSPTVGPLVLAVVVGVGAGLGAVFFRWLIGVAHDTLFGAAGRWLGGLGSFRYVLVPAVGGLGVGPLVYYLAREAKGHGVPEVMLAVNQEGGRIRPRVAVIKSLASALCIGSGGSVGREGPIVQIGSALGSTLGQVLGLPDQRIRLLVGCGAAGGIAATFNAPIAGTLFALEVILRDFAARSFGMVVISSAAATVVARATLGDVPAFHAPPHALRSPWELPLYVLLGLVCALMAVLFTKVLYASEDAFDQWKAFPEPLKPVVGGLMIGLTAVVFPEIWGVGYEAIEQSLAANLDVALCATLIVIKIAATSFAIGSGGSGGVFAPSLFIGAMVGTAFGAAAHAVFPGITASTGAYALVAMGALFAGAARAPVTSVLILFEMTGDYRIIVPLMCAVVTSALVAEHLSRDDIYTTKLGRRGVHLPRVRRGDPLETITVQEVMTRDLDVVHADDSLEALSRLFTETGHHGFPVLDDRDHLVGVVTLSDLAEAAHGDTEGLTVGDVASSPAMVCHPDQSLREALRQVGQLNVGRLPVVERSDHSTLVGILRRHDVIGAYARAAAGEEFVEKHVSHPYEPADDELD